MTEAAFFNSSLTAAQIQGMINASGVTEAYVTQSPAAPNFEGQNITLTATVFAVTNGNQYGQFWVDNGVKIAGQTGSTLVLTNVHTTNSGNYALVMTNITPLSVTSAPVVLTVVAGPPIIVAQPGNQTRYSGPTANATFSVGVVGTIPYTYQWSFATASATNIISGATNSSYTVMPVQSGNAGSYFVMVTNPHGSVTSSKGALTVVAAPASFPALVMADGPESFWPLNETSGATALDYVSGFNGTMVGAAGSISNNQPGPSSPTYPGMPAAGIAYAFAGSNTVAACVMTGLKGITGTTGTMIALVNPAAPPKRGSRCAPNWPRPQWRRCFRLGISTERQWWSHGLRLEQRV